jgi:predicted membrane protein
MSGLLEYLDDAIEVLNWVATVVAIFGTYLVSNFNRKGFFFWVVSNTFFCFYNLFYLKNFAGFALFAIYLGITLRTVFREEAQKKQKKYKKINTNLNLS